MDIGLPFEGPINGKSRCMSWGHRPMVPRFFGPDRSFFVRACRRCFYIEAGRILMNRSTGQIRIEVQQRYGSYKKSLAQEKLKEPVKGNDKSNGNGLELDRVAEAGAGVGGNSGELTSQPSTQTSNSQDH